jgi:hypothetical protein
LKSSQLFRVPSSFKVFPAAMPLLAATLAWGQGTGCFTGDGRELSYPKYYNPATGTYDFTDADATHLEGNGSALESKLTTPVKARLACLKAKIAHVGGSSFVSSAYRPYEYQDHFYDLYRIRQEFRGMQPSDEDQGACLSLYNLVTSHMQDHGFSYPARPNVGAHVRGMGFDLPFTLPKPNRVIDHDASQDEYTVVRGYDPPTRLWQCAWGWCEFGSSIERDAQQYPALKCTEGTDHLGQTMTGLEGGMIKEDLLETCDANENYTSEKKAIYELLKSVVTIDFFARRCGLWRRYFPKKQAEWNHFECIDNSECDE